MWRADSPEGPSEPQHRAPSLRALAFGCAAFAVLGALAMVYLHGVGLLDGAKYHLDLTQSPNWMAYHGDAFAKDDLLVEYSSYNESPVQNALYWLGTFAVDVVLLNKVTGIAIFAATTALFFALASQMAGYHAGVLAALLFIVLPRSVYEIGGGFSKAWAIGLLLITVWVIEQRRWGMLLWLMPLAALAYPISPVLIGATVLAAVVLELPRVAEALRGFKYLCAASALAVLPLLYKYLTPPARIGEMISTAKMKAMWRSGESSSYTVPLWEELSTYLLHPFFVYGTILLLMCLGSRRVVWKRSWTALVIASVLCYYVSDLVVPRLYLPDRYCRFTFAVLSVLFFSHNAAQVIGTLRQRSVRLVALAAVVVLAIGLPPRTFRPCTGDEAQGLWEDESMYRAVSQAVAREPLPMLVAGHPYDTSNVVVQARRPVLVVNRMFHAWFTDYRAAIDARIRDTFRAIYARAPEEVDALAASRGVTHLVVRKDQFEGRRVREGRIYRKEFEAFIASLTSGSGRFVLNPPPPEAIVFEDPAFWLVRLPLRPPQDAQ